MDIKNKKEEIQKKFDQVNQQITTLSQLREQLRGQYALLEEQEKEVPSETPLKEKSKK